MIEKAKAFALEAHKDTKYGALPYSYHLQKVVDVLKFTGRAYDDTVFAAAWLHDVVEDTDVTLGDIRREFGGHVAQLVDCVTDEPGKNRRERKAGMYKKLAAGPSVARAIKLADRIANTEASIENAGLSAMYRKEFPEFIQKVGIDSENDDLILRLFWLNLDSQESSK